MARFSTVSLADNRVLIKGKDVLGNTGETVVDGSQWAEVKGHAEFNRATEAFDAAVEAWVKPITDAAEALEKAVAAPSDPAFYVVLEEGTEGAPATAGVTVKLSHDSVVLRLIEEGNADRLIWVMGQLEIQQVVNPVPVASSGEPFDVH